MSGQPPGDKEACLAWNCTPLDSQPPTAGCSQGCITQPGCQRRELAGSFPQKCVSQQSGGPRVIAVAAMARHQFAAAPRAHSSQICALPASAAASWQYCGELPLSPLSAQLFQYISRWRTAASDRPQLLHRVQHHAQLCTCIMLLCYHYRGRHACVIPHGGPHLSSLNACRTHHSHTHTAKAATGTMHCLTLPEASLRYEDRLPVPQTGQLVMPESLYTPTPAAAACRG